MPNFWGYAGLGGMQGMDQAQQYDANAQNMAIAAQQAKRVQDAYDAGLISDEDLGNAMRKLSQMAQPSPQIPPPQAPNPGQASVPMQQGPQMSVDPRMQRQPFMPQGQGAQQIPPYQDPMQMQPPQAQPQGMGQIPPPAVQPQNVPRQQFSFEQLVQMGVSQGLDGKRLSDMIYKAEPLLNAEGKVKLAEMRMQELAVNNQRLQAALDDRIRHEQVGEGQAGTRIEQGDRRLDQADARMKAVQSRFNAKLSGKGGGGKLTGVQEEYSPDGVVIGYRGIRNGQIVHLDYNGNSRNGEKGASATGVRLTRYPEDVAHKDTQSLLSELRTLDQSLSKTKEDVERIKLLKMEIAHRQPSAASAAPAAPAAATKAGGKPKPSAGDLAYLKAHPEARAGFIQQFGSENLPK